MQRILKHRRCGNSTPSHILGFWFRVCVLGFKFRVLVLGFSFRVLVLGFMMVYF